MQYSLYCEKCKKLMNAMIPVSYYDKYELDKHITKVLCKHCGEKLIRIFTPISFRMN